MNRERRQQVDEVFEQALDLHGEARRIFLEENCRETQIRQEVDRLLDAADAAPEQFDSRFQSIRDKLWTDVFAPEDEDLLSGQKIGPWRVGERLARGGLATVYLAHREGGEFEQAAAFKVLRRGLDTDDLIARFRTERQILSALEHPAIAHILDGGALPDGRPYLVLEYVDGESITEYSQKAGLGIRERIRLIIQVLNALQHAHRRLIVHRDIKPSNILVSAEGNVTLLDFGIAKLLDPDAVPGTSMLTRTGHSVLTPAYSSPEQRAGKPVTTASDIYQVGVVLYELLAGSRPSLNEQEAAMVPPSQLLRGTESWRRVHGDLDAIVGKAMHPEEERRYHSAGEMVADLERFLAGRPIVAQPDTLRYRLRKLARRKPWLLPLVVLLVVSVLTYVVTLTLYSEQLRAERALAETARLFLADVLKSADPFAPADPERGRHITVVEALELGRKRLQGRLSSQPELRSMLLGTIAGVYQSLDQIPEALDLGEQALALNIELYGEDSEPVLGNLRLLAKLYNAMGDYAKARVYFDRQLEIARDLHPAHSPLLGVAEVAAGNFRKSQGDLQEGLVLLTGGIEKLRRAPETHAATLITAILSWTERDGTNDAPASLQLLEEGLLVADAAFEPDSLYAAQLHVAIGRNAFFDRDRERANASYRSGLQILEKKLGREHSATLTALQDYGATMNVTGDHRGAELLYREIIARLIAAGGERTRTLADNTQNLATALTRQGRLEESLPLHRDAYQLYRSVLPPDHYIIAFPLLSMAYIRLEREDAPAAEEAAREALMRLQKSLPGSYAEGVARCLVGLALERQGSIAEGSALVASSHGLILQRDVLVPTYRVLCRVPGDPRS